MIIKGGWVVEDYTRNYRDGAVVIEDDRIVDVGPTDAIMRKHSGAGHDIINAKNKIIIPGLINSHTHISMTLLRGYADDLLLQEWLEKWIWPFEAKLSGEDIELGAILGGLESIRFGTTTVYSMYHYHDPYHNEASGILKVGLRGTVGIAVFEWSRDENIKAFYDALERWHGKNGLIRVSLGPHAPYTVGPKTWRLLGDIWREVYEKYKDVIISSHMAEDWREVQLVKDRFKVDIPGDSLFKYLEKFNVLSSKFLAAHAIHLNEIDFKVISKYKVGIVHNPIANMKLAMGISPIPKLLDRNIIVSLGTDGAASNNTLDMFETMKVTALIHKVIQRNPRVLPAHIVFRLATEYGGLNLGFRDLGKIKPGYKADIVILNRRKAHLTPIYDIYSHLIYAAKGTDVETVIINGKVIYDKTFLNIDEYDIYDKVEKKVSRILEEVKTDEHN